MAEALAGLGHNGTGDRILGNVTQRQFLEFIDRYADADNECRQAVARRKDLRSAIKAAGIPLPAFDRMRRDSEKSGDVREREDVAYRQMMIWRMKPVGFQATMDLQSEDPDAQAFNVHELHRIDSEGFEAGKGGRRRDSNSYTPGTEAYQRWDTAWVRGQAEIASTLSQGGGGTEAANGAPKRRGRPKGKTDSRPRKRAERAPRAEQEPAEQVH